jgi:GTP-binding protein
VTAIGAGRSINSSSRQSFVTVTAVDDQAAANAISPTADDSDLDGQPEILELQLQLPPPTNVLVKTADFVKSSVKTNDCPPPNYPEFAVIGRSNVGKSSLINMLTNRKNLAMVSKEPGKQAAFTAATAHRQQL